MHEDTFREKTQGQQKAPVVANVKIFEDIKSDEQLSESELEDEVK